MFPQKSPKLTRREMRELAQQREQVEQRLTANNTTRPGYVDPTDYGTEALVDVDTILDQVRIAVPHVSGLPTAIETGGSGTVQSDSQCPDLTEGEGKREPKREKDEGKGDVAR
jgi:hypothetical protein